MNSLSNEKVLAALSRVMDPELNRNLVELGMVRQIEIEGGRVRIQLALTFAGCPLKEQIAAEAKEAVSQLEGVDEVSVELTEMSDEERRRVGLGGRRGVAEDANQISRSVAIMSGKGGVGKSFVSALLAVSLRELGQAVGILDADITGPSIPKMFGLRAKPHGSPQGIRPVETRKGIKVISINLLLGSEDEAVIWRGPLISAVIRQFWGDVLWGQLDWLVVDLPPGTSDASLMVMQSLPLSGVVLVSSPQDLAEMVVRKAARMAQRMAVPVLGLVENMSYFTCPDSNRRYDIFGPSRGEAMAERLGIPFLGRLPLDPRVAALCDAGEIESFPTKDFIPVAQRLIEEAPPSRLSPVQPKM